MDFNGDGLQDVFIGGFSGIPQWLERSAEGFLEPTHVQDKGGNWVSMGQYWDFELEEWVYENGKGSSMLSSSMAAVDWDADGDLDLLLGGYKSGALHLRLNEGSATAPQYAFQNQVVEAVGEPIEFEHGIAAPRIVDWNGDGLFDLVIGSIYGGVYLAENAGTASAPVFKPMITLVEPIPGEAGSKQVKMVATQERQPAAPGSSFHVEPVDYDGDGDLDLLVGARSLWSMPPAAPVDPAVVARFEELTKLLEKTEGEIDALLASAKDRKAARSTDAYRDLVAAERELGSQHRKLRKVIEPKETGDFIWLFRRK